MDYSSPVRYVGGMAPLCTFIRKAAAKLVFAVLFLCSVLLAPAHAVAMTVMELEPAAHAMAVPCPMSGGMMGDHSASQDASTDERSAVTFSCCPAPALGATERHFLPVRAVKVSTVEPVWDARAALSDPGVDLQPPRG